MGALESNGYARDKDTIERSFDRAEIKVEWVLQ